MAAGREVDVFVVTEKLDDVDGGVQLQAAAASRPVIDVLWAHAQDHVAHASAADHGRFDVVDARTPLTIGDSLTLSASSEAIHLFHPETGVALK